MGQFLCACGPCLTARTRRADSEIPIKPTKITPSVDENEQERVDLLPPSFYDEDGELDADVSAGSSDEYYNQVEGFENKYEWDQSHSADEMDDLNSGDRPHVSIRTDVLYSSDFENGSELESEHEAEHEMETENESEYETASESSEGVFEIRADNCLILDNGPHTIVSGYSSESVHSLAFSNAIGDLRFDASGTPKFDPTLKKNSPSVGSEADLEKRKLKLEYSISNDGEVQWDRMKLVWGHVCQKLLVNPRKNTLLVSLNGILGTHARKDLALLAFDDEFDFGAVCLVPEPVLSLLASGRSTGVVVTLGSQGCHIVPVFEGHPVDYATEKLHFGGDDLTKHFAHMLKKKHTQVDFPFESDFGLDTMRSLKENHCFVAQDLKEEMANSTRKSEPYQITGSQWITLNQERFLCPEAFFQPVTINSDDQDGLHLLVANSIKKCDPDLHEELLKSIILCGGSSLFDGLANRLEREISALFPSQVVCITSIEEVPEGSGPKSGKRHYSVWHGAKRFTQLDNFARFCITNEEFYENGVDIIEYKKYT